MTNLIQTHAAPDLLTFDKREDGQDVMVLAGKQFPIRNVGRRERDPMTEVVVSVADLRSLGKEAYKLGWRGKCIHIEALQRDMNKEIG